MVLCDDHSFAIRSEFTALLTLQHYYRMACSVHFSRSVMSDSVTPWTPARQASLSINNYPSHRSIGASALASVLSMNMQG